MGDMLSQAEIDALLNGTSLDGLNSSNEDLMGGLTSQEIDALGEVGNISMGTAATTLFTLLGQKVLITTPKVTVVKWEDMRSDYNLPLVAVKVEYTDGLIGSNLLILKEEDVKIITDLMMGGDGGNISGDLTDLHLSAIGEAMNQMVGSSSTSMSAMFDKRIDISPPKAALLRFDEGSPFSDFDANQQLVKISFRMVIGNLIDSEIMQLLPSNFAKDLVGNLLNSSEGQNYGAQPSAPAPSVPPPAAAPQYAPPPVQPAMQEPQYGQMPPMQQGYGMDSVEYGTMPREPQANRNPVNVQPVQFQSFDEGRIMNEKKNISLIMDVPLQVTVELGRTQKLIRDILEFGPGSIIELDKLAGEPVDILVNGKAIAKGEVVVIDESFGVRITDIIHPSKRLS